MVHAGPRDRGPVVRTTRRGPQSRSALEAPRWQTRSTRGADPAHGTPYPRPFPPNRGKGRQAEPSLALHRRAVGACSPLAHALLPFPRFRGKGLGIGGFAVESGERSGLVATGRKLLTATESKPREGVIGAGLDKDVQILRQARFSMEGEGVAPNQKKPDALGAKRVQELFPVLVDGRHSRSTVGAAPRPRRTCPGGSKLRGRLGRLRRRRGGARPGSLAA
jgi:hypothetical protein